MAHLRPFLSRLYGMLGLIVIVVLHVACVAMAIFSDEPRGIIIGLMWSYGMAIYVCILFFFGMVVAFVILALTVAATIFCLDRAFGKDEP